MPIAEHSSTPAVVQRALGTSGIATTASFSPPGQSLIIAMVVWMWHPGPGGTTLSVADSLSNSYTRVVEFDHSVPKAAAFHRPQPTTGTSSGIFTFYYNTAPGAITVTATASSTAPASAYLVVRVLTGAASAQAGTGYARNIDDGLQTLQITQAASWAYCTGGSWAGSVTPAVNPATYQIGSWQDLAGSTCQAIAGRLAAPSAVPGRVQLGWITGINSLCCAEILAAPQAPPPQPVFSKGQVLDAAAVNGWLLPATAFKATATQISSNTTLTADPDLQVALAGPGWYAFRMLILYEGPSGANFQWSWTVPGTTGWSFTVQGTPSNNTYFDVLTSQAPSISTGQLFTDQNNPGSIFQITGQSAFFGFENEFFSPSAASVMAAPDVVTQVPSSMAYTARFVTTAGNYQEFYHSAADVPQASTDGGTTDLAIQMDGVIYLAQSGTVTFNWAQITSNSGNTFVDAGSYLTAWRIG